MSIQLYLSVKSTQVIKDEGTSVYTEDDMKVALSKQLKFGRIAQSHVVM